MSTAAVKRYTVEEYLAFERAAQDVKHEFYDGQVFVLARTDAPHDLIVQNLQSILKGNHQGRVVYLTDMRIRSSAGLFMYSDITVISSEPEFADDYHDIILNPTVIFEVLSPSTEAYDRGKKFGHYKTISSLREYILVAQDRASIDHFVRQDDGRWLMTSVNDLNSELVMPALDLAVSSGDVYAKVEFAPEAELPEGSTLVFPSES